MGFMQSFIKGFISFLLCLPVLCLKANTLTDLNYITEQYPPYNYQNDRGEFQGIAVDVLNKVWQELGISPQTIQLYPWARGYSLALNKENTLLFSTTRSPSREHLFKWACPIINIRIVLIARKEANIRIDSIEAAKQYKIVAIKSDIGHQLLIDKQFNQEKIHLSNYLTSAVNMMKHGHVSLLSSSEVTVFQHLKAMNEDPNDYQVAWVLETNPSCFAFHHKVDDKLIERFQKALNKVNDMPNFISDLKKKYPLETK